MEIKKELLNEKISTALELLEKDDIWKKQYEEYAVLMTEYEEEKTKLSKKFKQWKSLKFYLTVGNAKEGPKSLKISVRHLGQEVAEIRSSAKGVNLVVSEKRQKTNENNFEYDKKLNVPWNSEEAKEFREYLQEKERIDNGKANEEHRLESLLLTEFLKMSSKDKLLCGIQPVTFIGYRFPMPTAITASEIKNGANVIKIGLGHIDILARVKNGREVNLVVFEVKDKNEEKENVNNLLQQATGYATFLIKLLRSEFGQKWYKILGFNGNLPPKLTVKVCSAMPVKENGEYDTFEKFSLDCGNDKIEYHWLYFKEVDNKIIEMPNNLK